MTLDRKTLFIFLDEGGNLDFSKSGTKFFSLSSVSKFRPFEAYKNLNELKYDLIEDGNLIEYFHASEDRQAIRDQVFKIIRERFNDSLIDCVIVEKSKTEPENRDEEKFYTMIFGKLIRNILQKTDNADISKIIIFTDRLPLKKKKKAVEKGLKTILSLELNGKIPYTILHHQSKSNYDLQLADYCNWAIYRKWEKGDVRSYELIKNYLRSETDIYQI